MSHKACTCVPLRYPDWGSEGQAIERPNYAAIAALLRGGYVIPFLGAGASVFHGMGSNPDGEPALRPPTASELANFLAERCNFPEACAPERRKDLALVASYLRHVGGGETFLRITLREKFRASFDLNSLHRLLATAAVQKPILIITTNYDDLIEKAFNEKNVAHHVVVTNVNNYDQPGCLQYKAPGSDARSWVHPNDLYLSLDDASVIYKMHGSVNRGKEDEDSYIITEEHYTRFLGSFSSSHASLVPRALEAMMRRKQFLFLGYSLRDWNLRVLLESLWTKEPNRDESWAIQADPDIVEGKIWEKKGVKVYGVDLRDFVDQLSSYFEGRPDC